MLAPHGGRNFPSLEQYVAGAPAESQTPEQMQAVMRRYRAGAGIERTYPPGYTGPR